MKKVRRIKYAIPSRLKYIRSLSANNNPSQIELLPAIAERANLILRGKSHNDIFRTWRSMVRGIHHISVRSRIVDINHNQTLKELVAKPISSRHRFLLHWLKYNTEAELFAIVALALVNSSLHCFDVNKKMFLPDKQDMDFLSLNERQLFAVNKALLALDAVCYAEHLIEKRLAKTEEARKAANARHAEDKAAKAQAVEHYIKNKHIYKSKDSAAESIAGKIVPYKVRVVRDWLKGV